MAHFPRNQCNQQSYSTKKYFASKNHKSKAHIHTLIHKRCLLGEQWNAGGRWWYIYLGIIFSISFSLIVHFKNKRVCMCGGYYTHTVYVQFSRKPKTERYTASATSYRESQSCSRPSSSSPTQYRGHTIWIYLCKFGLVSDSIQSIYFPPGPDWNGTYGCLLGKKHEHHRFGKCIVLFAYVCSAAVVVERVDLPCLQFKWCANRAKRCELNFLYLLQRCSGDGFFGIGRFGIPKNCAKKKNGENIKSRWSLTTVRVSGLARAQYGTHFFTIPFNSTL